MCKVLQKISLLLYLSIIIVCMGCSVTYHGIVKDFRTGSPLEGVTVKGIYSTKKFFALNFDIHTIKTTTDSLGKFEIKSPKKLNCLYVTKHGYDPYEFSFTKWVGRPLKAIKWDPKETIIIKLKSWKD